VVETAIVAVSVVFLKATTIILHDQSINIAIRSVVQTMFDCLLRHRHIVIIAMGELPLEVDCPSSQALTCFVVEQPDRRERRRHQATTRRSIISRWIHLGKAS
jgi:hypothetical protein